MTTLSATVDPAIANEQQYILQTYPRPDFVLERGEGVYLYDTAGRQYLDFVAGIAVNGLGYGDPALVQAMHAQATRLVHVSNLYHTIPGSELAQRLIADTPAFQRVFFCNSGTEAVEGAIKFARKFAHTHHNAEKKTIVAFDGSFHGRTIGALSVTARETLRRPFEPLMPNVRFAAFNDTDGLADAITADVCAVIVEPVQGEGGLRVASAEFLRQLRMRCDQHNALLITDEIQCGLGRTGTLWAYEPYDIRPDMLTIAKPLANGLPIGAVLLHERVAATIQVGDHGTTFGGGPLVTAVAQVVYDRISHPAFLQHIREVSDYLDAALVDLMQRHPERVLELRGRGLMRGLRINGSAAAIRAAGHQAGLLVATAGEDVVRLLPPLIIEPAHVDEASAKLDQLLA